MKIKNLKINKKIAALALIGTITLSSIGIGFIKHYPNLIPNKLDNGETVSFYTNESMYNGEIISISESQITNVYSYNSDWDLVVYKGKIGFVAHQEIDDIAHDDTAIIEEIAGTATITAKSGLRFRLGPGTDYKRVTAIPFNTKVQVLGVTANNWYVVKYNEQIGYVSGDYVKYEQAQLTEKPKPLIKEEEPAEETKDPNAIYATTNVRVNFRVGPSTLEKKITIIDKNTEVEFLEATENNWYKIRYQGQIGYIYGKYLNYTPPVVMRDNYTKVVYTTTDTPVKESPDINSNTQYTMSEYETCEVISEDGEWLKIRCAGFEGYIPKINTINLSDVFVIIDIGDQKLRMYKDNNLILETDVVTGKKGSHDTPHGLFSIQSKTKDTYLTGADYRVHVDYWMPFYYGYGLHDADWRSTFGGTYYESSGSHGCVNIPDEQAKEIYDTVSVGTKVLVHK